MYKPTAVDIAWANNLISIISDNAIWGWPDLGLIYLISKKDKTLTLTNPEILTHPECFNGHEQTQQVFKAIGYEVRPL